MAAIWMTATEIAGGLALPDTKGKELVTAAKVGKVVTTLGLKEPSDVCHPEQSRTTAGHDYTQYYYDWEKVGDRIYAELGKKWPEIQLRLIITVPDHVEDRASKFASVIAINTAVAKVEGKREWSGYQKAIFSDVDDGNGHLVVMARAGSGKTTTIMECLKHLDRREKILLCAFSKTIQRDLKAKSPSYVTVDTLHAIGLRLIKRNSGAHGADLVDVKKVSKIVADVLSAGKYESLLRGRHKQIAKNATTFVDSRQRTYEARQMVRKLVSLAKNTLAESQEDFVGLYYHYEIGDSTSVNAVVTAAQEALKRSNEHRDQIDFDDMIYYPWLDDYGAPGRVMERYDTVFVDEAQDLNAAQIWLIRRLCRHGGRIIAFGDDRQAIYGFRGADSNAIPLLTEGLDAKTLPLSVSYRCPQSVVALAQEVVADIEWAPNAPIGESSSCTYQELISSAAKGDFILSRTNAPLMSVWFDLLKREIPATITGRDIGAALQAMVKKSRANTTSQLRTWLTEWVEQERENLLPEQQSYFNRQCEKAEALRILMRDCKGIGDIVMKLDKMFSDETPTSRVICSTVHKAKGLERERVWMLHDTFQMGRGATEEDNIWYVAVTRSMNRLHLCETPISQIVGALQS